LVDSIAHPDCQGHDLKEKQMLTVLWRLTALKNRLRLVRPAKDSSSYKMAGSILCHTKVVPFID